MKSILKISVVAIIINCQLSIVNSLNAQTDSTKNPLKISGYLETYYVYDFGNPFNHNRPGFVYSHNRHNEVNLNLGYVQAEYNNEKVRGKLALMTGTYANANLAAEPGVLKNIFEANAGVKISKTKNLWVEAGIFASHIGFESAIGANCWNMTRSILADNSPYFESGAKISYTSDDEKWFLSGLILNGWQRIQRVAGNQTPAFGHQLTWKPNEKITLNSSSFIGSDTPDSLRQMRYFHNFYSQIQLNEKLGLITGFDIGAQQVLKGRSEYYIWYSPIMIVKYSLSEKLALSARVEYYSDKDGVIINTETLNGFQTFGYSLNMDVSIVENVLWRIETRTLRSRVDDIFINRNEIQTKNNSFIGTSFSITF
jgi:hypothetical protein